jgi:lauroyl/myristoyl acyltransferase
MAAPAHSTPAHGPALGPTRRLLGRLHITGVFWYRFHLWGVTHLPPAGLRVGLALFTMFFFVALSRIRGAIGSNLEPVLGPAGRLTRWSRAYRTLHEFAECQSEKYLQAAKPDRVQYALEGEAHWREATDGGRGALLVTAHVGPWEVATQLGASESRRRVHVVREAEIDPRAQAFVRDQVRALGPNHVTHFAADDLRLAVELRDALRQGDIVALQGDRPRADGRSVTTRIFGREWPLPVGPAALARAAGVPIVPVFNFRDGSWKMRTVVRPPLFVPVTADREADIAAAMQRFAAEVEWAIRQRPHQWFCFRRLWD